MKDELTEQLRMLAAEVNTEDSTEAMYVVLSRAAKEFLLRLAAESPPGTTRQRLIDSALLGLRADLELEDAEEILFGKHEVEPPCQDE